MDKTHHISLGGFSFLIEEKAYQELSSYLHSVRVSLKNNPDTDEIIYDVEQRMAELLPPKMAGRQVIISSDVDFLIAKLGRPEQYIDEDFSTENTASASEENTEKKLFRSQKLYRDMENKKLGGVLAGLSHYLGFEVIWLRIIFLLSIFAFGSGVVLYIVFWVVIPPAITTAEKLEMKGKSVNINTISSFKDEANAFASKLYRSHKNRLLGGVLSGIANAMNWELTWVRLIFLLAFFGFIPFTGKLSGLLLIIYIILWIVLPSEKINFIFDKNPSEDNSKEEKNHFVSEEISSEEKLKIYENQDNTIQRNVVANEFKFGIWQIFRAIFKGLGYLVVGFIAFFLLMFAISLILAMMGISFLGLGIGFTGLVMEDFLPYLLAGEWQMWVTYIAGILLLILPFSIVTILCLKLFSKNGYQTPRFWVLTNVFAFFFGVFGIILVVINTLTHFQTSAWLEETKMITPTDTLSLSFENTSETLYLDEFVITESFYLDENKHLIRDDRAYFSIMPTTEKEPSIVIKKRGKGKNVSDARAVAEKIQYPMKVEGNQLIFPKQIFCGKDTKMRSQRINIYLYLPEGTKLTTSEKSFRAWNEVALDEHRFRKNTIFIKNGDIYKMTKEGLIKE